jgi:hypothetical protein
VGEHNESPRLRRNGKVADQSGATHHDVDLIFASVRHVYDAIIVARRVLYQGSIHRHVHEPRLADGEWHGGGEA